MPTAGSDFKRCTLYPFKIKETLLQQKTIDIKKKRANSKNIKCQKKIKVFYRKKYTNFLKKIAYCMKYFLIQKYIRQKLPKRVIFSLMDLESRHMGFF